MPNKKIKKYFKMFNDTFNPLNFIFGYPSNYKQFLKNPKEDYDDYWKKREENKDRFRFSLNMKWWEKLLSQRYQKSKIVSDWIENESSVLDLGSGEGAVLEFIKQYKDIKGIGADISSFAINKLKAKGFDGFVLNITNEDELNNLASVDYVLLLDILEHIQFPEQLLMQLKQKINKGILINVPNTAHYLARLRLLFGKAPFQGLYFPGEHIRFWSISDFKFMCKKLGFKIKKKKSAFGTCLLKNLWPNLFSSSEVYFLEKK